MGWGAGGCFMCNFASSLFLRGFLVLCFCCQDGRFVEVCFVFFFFLCLSPSCLEEEVEVVVVVVVVPDDFSFLEKLTSRGLKLCISGHGLLCCRCCCLQCFFSFLGRVGCFLLVFCFVLFF